MRSTSDAESAGRKIMELLSRESRPVTTQHICTTLNLPKSLASSVLYKLMKEGLIERIYTEEYDPSQPFDTASWILKSGAGQHEKKEEPGGGVEAYHAKLVLSIPLSMYGMRAELLNKFKALDFHDAYTHVIEMSENELKIMSPVIDVYALYPLLSKIRRSGGALKVRVLTEVEKSRDAAHLLRILKGGNVEVKNVEKVERYANYERKIFGVHAKLVLADDEVALLGSFNLSSHHYLVNFDIGFLIYDQRTVASLSSIFNEVWNHV